MISHALVIIAFRRKDHLQDTLKALAQNYGVENVPLYIFIDGPRGTKEDNPGEHKQVQDVRELCEHFSWKGEKVIHAAITNKGLLNNVRYAIDTTLSKYESAIIVEDDILTSPYFYEFVAQGLEKFQDVVEVAAICGFCSPYSRKLFNPTEPYFLRNFACWGWATWRRAWNNICWDVEKLMKEIKPRNKSLQIDFGNSGTMSAALLDKQEGLTNSWAISTAVSFFLNNQMCLFPQEAFTNNIGWHEDGMGTHTFSKINPNPPLLYKKCVIPQNIKVEESRLARKAYQKLLCPFKVTFISFFKNILISLIGRKNARTLRTRIKSFIKK